MRTYLSVLLLLLLSSGCAQDKEYDALSGPLYSDGIPTIHPAELHDTLAAGYGVVLLDSRELREYNVSHLKNAIHIGYDTLNLDPLIGMSKDTLIVIYCSVGYRSEKIAEKLIAAGYTNVLNLEGGIFEWVNEGYMIVDNSDQSTKKVHAYSRVWGVWLKKGEKVYD